MRSAIGSRRRRFVRFGRSSGAPRGASLSGGGEPTTGIAAVTVVVNAGYVLLLYNSERESREDAAAHHAIPGRRAHGLSESSTGPSEGTRASA